METNNANNTTNEKIHERLAIIEVLNKAQSNDLKEVLQEVKSISKKLASTSTKVNDIAECNLPTRMTKIETREKIYGKILAGVLSGTGIFSIFWRWWVR